MEAYGLFINFGNQSENYMAIFPTLEDLKEELKVIILSTKDDQFLQDNNNDVTNLLLESISSITEDDVFQGIVLRFENIFIYVQKLHSVFVKLTN